MGPDWLPITDADGDHVCVDKKSRVLAFTNAGASARVIAPSLVAWLGRVPRYIRAERNEDSRRAAQPSLLRHACSPTVPSRGSKLRTSSPDLGSSAT